jgi:hypothetical protein
MEKEEKTQRKNENYGRQHTKKREQLEILESKNVNIVIWPK